MGGSDAGVDLGLDVGDVVAVVGGTMEGGGFVVLGEGVVEDCSMYCSAFGEGTKDQVKDSPSSK